MGTLVGTFEKYPPLTHWVKVEQIVSEPSIYSAWTYWVIDPLPPVRSPAMVECSSMAQVRFDLDALAFATPPPSTQS